MVISNLACVSDAAVAALEQYAQAGGGLIAGYEAGLFDADGKPRATPAFDAMMGITRKAKREGLKSSYAKLEARDDPLLDRHWRYGFDSE